MPDLNDITLEEIAKLINSLNESDMADMTMFLEDTAKFALKNLL
jgi:hypothetical protein